MTIHNTCPYCGRSADLRLEGMSTNQNSTTVQWQVISCLRCKLVFNVNWDRDIKAETRLFGDRYA